MPFMKTRAIWSLLLLFVTLSTPALAQPEAQAPAADVAALGEELARLRHELGSLRAEVATLRRAMETPAPTVIPAVYSPPAPPTLAESGARAAVAAVRAELTAQPAVTPEALEMLQAQVEEQAQSKVESASKMPVRLSGTVLANTYVNSGEANWLENPNIVAPPPPDAVNRGSMSATARQSRIGLDVGVIPVGDWRASGTLVFDFFGGVPNFQNGTVMGLPRLLIAFGRMEHGGTAIEVGQDHMMLAPRDPTSLAALSFPLFFRSGNLYLRAPQARVEQRFGGWTLATGIVAPIAGDFTGDYEFAPAAGAGERSKRPAVQSRLGFANGDADAPREVAVGVSGHYGWRRMESALQDSWAVAVDGNARAGRLGVAGEYFVAENAEVFGGAISQAGRTSGGWVEARFALTSRLDLNGGFGIDRPDDAVGRLVRSENRSAFGNFIIRLTPEVATSLEYRWLETEAGLLPITRRNHHLNAVFAVKF